MTRLALVAVAVAAAWTAEARCPDDGATRAAVAAARAEAALQCDCASAVSRRIFVSCVADVARALVLGGTLPRACRSAVVRCATASTCGAPGTVTCCTTRNEVTRCRHGLGAAQCTARGGTPCTGPFPACCADCVQTGCTPTTTTTSTTLPASCNSGPAPACGGACPAGQVCQAGQTIHGATTTRFCQCVAAGSPCAPLTMDCDFGVCPPGLSCTAWFDVAFCGCL